GRVSEDRHAVPVEPRRGRGRTGHRLRGARSHRSLGGPVPTGAVARLGHPSPDGEGGGAAAARPLAGCGAGVPAGGRHPAHRGGAELGRDREAGRGRDAEDGAQLLPAEGDRPGASPFSRAFPRRL
ncbi:MAG: hypothetical protein AVDCRST_MAG09-1888, partial [uncultured Sphingomonas sp.]